MYTEYGTAGERGRYQRVVTGRGGAARSAVAVFVARRCVCLDHLVISHSLSVLGWYIPGLSELPLGNRLPLLLGGPFQRFFVFSISLGIFGPFFLFSSFVSCACVSSEHLTVSEPGAVAGISGCWRVKGGLQGARLPLSCLGIACASRHEDA